MISPTSPTLLFQSQVTSYSFPLDRKELCEKLTEHPSPWQGSRRAGSCRKEERSWCPHRSTTSLQSKREDDERVYRLAMATYITPFFQQQSAAAVHHKRTMLSRRPQDPRVELRSLVKSACACSEVVESGVSMHFFSFHLSLSFSFPRLLHWFFFGVQE